MGGSGDWVVATSVKETFFLSNLALCALLIIFVARFRNALMAPATRISWAASGVGVLALFARGTIVPVEQLDRLLGGSNVINLVQNVLATVAFWLVLQAVMRRRESKLDKLRWLPLVGAVSAFTLAFFVIPDRGTTSRKFIIENVDQFALVAYASIYMLTIGTICTHLAVRACQQRGPVYLLFACGGALVALGCVVEVLFLFAEFGSFGSVELRAVLFHAFDPLFYFGVVLIAASIAILSARRGFRERRMRRGVRELEHALLSRGIDLPDSAVQHPLNGTVPDLDLLYRLTIVMRDHEAPMEIPWTQAERERLAWAETLVEEQVLALRVQGPLRTDEMILIAKRA